MVSRSGESEYCRATDTSTTHLTRSVHVYPDFNGNRSPVADPTLAGAIVGLRIDDTLESLACLYLATIQALAYSTRHVIETQATYAGTTVSELVVCGGLSKNPLYRTALADACGCKIVVPSESESMLLGSAVLGGVAAGVWPQLSDALSVTTVSSTQDPDPSTAAFHNAKYTVFRRMLEDQQSYQAIMATAT